MNKMWQGRFRERLDPGFQRWQRSLPFDRILLPEELAASRAYARVLTGAGILTETELAALLDGLDRIKDRVERDPTLLDNEEIEDIHHFVELQLVDLVGEVGLKLHTGRSRNEQIAADLRLFTRKSIDSIQERLADLIESFLVRAAQYSTAPMPAYTHLQRAEPVLLGHWLLAYAAMFFRDADRLADCRCRVNVLPLGSGAVAGTTVSLDRAALAAELGFEAVSANSLDATSDRDFALEFVQALSLLAMHLSRWAEEFALFASIEYGFLHLPEQFCTGSSAMPQKKNPDALELLRGKAGRVAGAATSLLLILKGLPLAYNKDLQETQEPPLDAARTAGEALGIAADLIRVVEFDTARMKAAATSGYLNATAAANYLVRRGIPFRQAHSIIGQAVQCAVNKACELESLSRQELRQFSPEFGEDFASALVLDAVLAQHDVPGGTNPERVKHALANAQRRLATLLKSFSAAQ
jgi:argininosuccinate lyase